MHLPNSLAVSSSRTNLPLLSSDLANTSSLAGAGCLAPTGPPNLRRPDHRPRRGRPSSSSSANPVQEQSRPRDRGQTNVLASPSGSARPASSCTASPAILCACAGGPARDPRALLQPATAAAQIREAPAAFYSARTRRASPSSSLPRRWRLRLFVWAQGVRRHAERPAGLRWDHARGGAPYSAARSVEPRGRGAARHADPGLRWILRRRVP